MKFRPILWIVALTLISIGVSPGLLAKSNPAAEAGFTAADQEFYLEADAFFFFRPGVAFELIDFEIPDDLQPVLTFKLTDPRGLPLDRNGVYTPGEISNTISLTYIPQGEEEKVSYTPFYDRGGVYTDEGDGVYTYKFAAVLPEDYDADATTSLVVVSRRDLTEYGLELYFDNFVYNFVPSGAEMVTPPREIVRAETCNRCHGENGVAMHLDHSGYFEEPQVCQQCHLPGLVRDGRDLNFKAVIHEVHSELAEEGEYPPAINDCEVCHTGGTPTEDFPLVANPTAMPACDANGKGMTEFTWDADSTVQVRLDAADGKLFAASNGSGKQATGKWMTDGKAAFLVDAASGEVLGETEVATTVFGCAGNAPGTFRGEAGNLHTKWLTNPSRAACGACHEHSDIDFASGADHPIIEDDTACSLCHTPTYGPEYTKFSVGGAHQVDYKSDQLGGVLVEIIDVQNTGPGDSPTVTFALSNKWGPLPPSYMGRLRFSLSGPNDDFTFYLQEDSVGSLTANGSNWDYTFEGSLPSDAMGSFSLGVEGRINGWVINEGQSNEFTMNDQMQNFIVPFAVTDSSPMGRRMVVDDYKCESCHSNLSLHGSNRHNASEYCQTCHMPSADDSPEREEGDTPQSIDFRYMIHKIHRGADLENGYVVLGHNGSVNDFSHVEYPGDLRDCEACHVDDSYTLPLPAGLEDVITPRDFFTPMGPSTAACLSCHDSQAAASHALSNSSELGEACAACHGEGKTYAVERVHAR
jgi:hypothetical protein